MRCNSCDLPLGEDGGCHYPECCNPTPPKVQPEINWQQRAEALAHDLEIAKSALKSAERDFQSQLHAQKQRAERLGPYLKHKDGCGHYPNGILVCNCGLDDARKEAV